jgi:CRP-like cAMP-binding protein
MPGGQRQTLYLYSEGDLMGYRQLLTGEPYPISALVLEDAEVLFISSETFRQLLDSSPHFARNLLTALAREFTVWMNRLTVFGQMPVRRRLALALLILYRQFGHADDQPGVISMTRTELAEYIGASLETVVRALNGLKTDGIVSISGRRMVVHSPLQLLDIFQEEEA